MTNVEIYTKDNCPYCDRAKAILAKGDYQVTEICAVENRDVLVERVTQATGVPPRTVPQIFIDGQHIGGHDDVVKFLAAS